MTEETFGEDTPQAEGNALEADTGAAETQDISDQPTEPQPEAETQGGADPAGETGDKGQVPDGVQKRIDEITRKRREAERRAERLERELAELKGRDLSNLDWEDQIAEKTYGRSQEAQLKNDREAAQELAREAYQARVEAAAVKYPDFHSVAGNPNLAITPAMAEAIMDSDYGPEVAYHLGKNPNEATRISNLNPVSQARELGRIEALVSQPKQAPKPAPAPVNPVGARSSGGTKDPSKMSMAEYVAWRSERGM